MDAYTKAARRQWASDRIALMRHVLPFLAAVLVLVIAGFGAQSQTAESGVTSLLGRPLAPMALEPDSAAKMEVELADAVAAWEKDRSDADALIWMGRRKAYLGRYREAITDVLGWHRAASRGCAHVPPSWASIPDGPRNRHRPSLTSRRAPA